ncbi:MAG TPA: hypothetical protein VF691_11160 [Cytophagaceae bacterium]|jgi:hypothetical protein
MHNFQFQNAVKDFAQHLFQRMGESRAIQFMNGFIKIPAGDELKLSIEALIMFACNEYGIDRETLVMSAKMIDINARITCYHLSKKYLKLSNAVIAHHFVKRKTDSIADGLLKAQGMIDLGRMYKDYISKYNCIEDHLKNYMQSRQ